MDIRFKRGNGGEGIFLEAYEIEPVRQKPSIPRVQALLLVATVFTTMVAGAMQAGVNPFSDPLQIYRGIPFSATLLTILGVHEMGHYFTSRKWGVRATLPYFIPAPSFIGTFGAIIRLKSQIPNRKALVEIGAAGPISGFILAVLASIIGLGLSPVVKTSELAGGISLGGSILFSFLTRFVVGEVPTGHDVLLHPMAFAGWLGMFVTALNLLPVGQLDGGHIVYSLFGKYHSLIAKLTVLILLPLGLMWPGWFFWAMLAMLFGTRHPPPFDSYTPLDENGKILGYIAIGIFVLSFMPVPFRGGF